MWLKARRPLAQDGPGRWYIRKWEYKLAWAPQVSGEGRPKAYVGKVGVGASQPMG